MTRRGTGAAVLVAAFVAGTAAARYGLTPGYPWTYSETGTETANALDLDFQDRVVVAGTITRPASPTGTDLLVQVYSITLTGQPIGSTEYDSGYGMNEGPPALRVVTWIQTGVTPQTLSYLAFNAPTPTVPKLGLIAYVNYFTQTVSLFEDAGLLPSNTAPAVCAGVSVTPYVVGSITADGVDQLYTARVPFLYTLPGWDYVHRVTATSWSGSLTLSVTGRAVVEEASGAFRIVAASGGDVVLYRYSTETYPDPTPQDLKALIDPAFPRRIVTPEHDEPEAAVLDVLGNLWVAGSIDNDGAIWQFDDAGNGIPGFPVRFNAGSPTRLTAIAVTADRHAVATGSAGGSLLLAGTDAAGVPLPSLPLVDPPPPLGGTVEGRGLALERDGSAWVAGTWRYGAGESAIRIWHFGFTADPPPVAPGEVVVRGPEGGLLNLARGETVAIMALPRQPGEVHAQVLTPRGEMVREFTATSRGNELVAFTWDGRNRAGEPVASGMYAVRVTGGDLKVVRRVVVVRKN